MNTLTIAVLVVCATMAYASAIPGQAAESAPVGAAAQPGEIFQAEESRHYRAGYGGGGHHGHGGHSGHGGGGYGGGGHHGHGGRRG